jgi:hypothetical protein
MKKSSYRRRNISKPEDSIFSSKKKYFRINNSIYELDKKSLDLISGISQKLRQSIRPEKTKTSRRNEIEKYFEQREK